MTMVESGDQYFISTKRIETLVDGIFAITMTLMVLNIHLPDPSGVWTNEMVWGVIWGQLNNLFIYALSFIILAGFWISHHRGFDQIKRADQSFLWINVVWLLFVALIPFSMSLMGDFGNTVPGALFFNVNLFFIGLFSFLIRRHVIENELADKKLNNAAVQHVYLANLTFPIISVVAIILSLFAPTYSSLVYLLLPMVLNILHRIQRQD
jgi:uncharacterized membrane protein